MVVLNKIRGSTLMETLVATVLIVVVFTVSSLVLNNLFRNSLNDDTGRLEEHLNQLQYLWHNNQLVVPYYETWDNWEIVTVEQYDGVASQWKLVATEVETQKTVKKLLINEHR